MKIWKNLEAFISMNHNLKTKTKTKTETKKTIKFYLANHG